MVLEAMDRLRVHLKSLGSGLEGLLSAASSSPDVQNSEEAIKDLLSDLQKYVNLGIWLCQGRKASSPEQNVDNSLDSALCLDEKIWVELTDAVVGLTQSVSSSFEESDQMLQSLDVKNVVRKLIQTTFTALLNSTAHQPLPHEHNQVPPTQARPKFLIIFREFLSRMTTSSP